MVVTSVKHTDKVFYLGIFRQLLRVEDQIRVNVQLTDYSKQQIVFRFLMRVLMSIMYLVLMPIRSASCSCVNSIYWRACFIVIPRVSSISYTIGSPPPTLYNSVYVFGMIQQFIANTNQCCTSFDANPPIKKRSIGGAFCAPCPPILSFLNWRDFVRWSNLQTPLLIKSSGY